MLGLNTVKKGLGKLAGIAAKLRPIAPVLVKGLEYSPGGPVAAAVLDHIVKAVGGEQGDIASIEAALDAATSEQLVELKREEAKFQTLVKKADIDIENAYLADRQDARVKHRDSWVPASLALGLNGAFVFGLLAPIFLPVNEETVQNIVLGIGPVAGSAGAYYYGSSRTQNRIAETNGGGHQ